MQIKLTLIKIRPYMLPLLAGLVLISIAGVWLFGRDAEPIAATKTETPTFDACLGTEDIPLKVSCWTAFFEHTMQTEGLQKTFEVFAKIYKADPAFVAEGCHGAVHVIGEMAYDIYRNDGDIQFSEETTACGYGFYHGFLGKLLHEKPNLEDAVRFCESLKSSPQNDKERIFTTCFHGIGHGMVEETPLAEYYWGNIDALLIPALETCGTLPEAYQQRECADGAFNGLSRFMTAGEYGFSYNTEDPLGWCGRFKENRINYTSCNFEMAQNFAATIIEKPGEVLPFIEGLDHETQIMVVDIAVGGLLQEDVVNDDHSDYFIQCRVFETPELKYACLNGVVGGLLEHGEPGNESAKPTAFCASSIATEEERASCNKILTSYLR
jgi:hypothetical protein